MSDYKNIEIGEIKELNLRQIFPREDTSFTPWLSMPENLGRLSNALGFELELLDTEVRSETFRVDILARRTVDDAIVIIENQFGRSDHGHLGQILTYLAAHDAKAVVWVAERFADEHRNAIEWLNENTGEEYGFFAVAPHLIQIGDSVPGLRFELEAKPNHYVKQIRSANRRMASKTLDTRESVWRAVQPRISELFPDASTRYGGRQGHLWIIPPNAPVMNGREVHVLLYLNLPKDGPQRFNYYLGCGQDLGSTPNAEATAFAKRVWLDAVSTMNAEQIEVGEIPKGLSLDESCAAYFEADLGDETALETCLDRAMPAVCAMYESLSRLQGA